MQSAPEAAGAREKEEQTGGRCKDAVRPFVVYGENGFPRRACALHGMTEFYPACHSEEPGGRRRISREILRCAQDDRPLRLPFVRYNAEAPILVGNAVLGVPSLRRGCSHGTPGTAFPTGRRKRGERQEAEAHDSPRRKTEYLLTRERDSFRIVEKPQGSSENGKPCGEESQKPP